MVDIQDIFFPSFPAGLSNTKISRTQLQNFVSSGGLVNTLRKIAINNDLLKSIACRSYRHYNAFDKIVLLPESSRFPVELRLHVWWADLNKASIENVHDHKWNFSSIILTGGYDYEVYEIDECGEKMLEFCYTTREGKANYQTPFVTKRNLTCVARGSVSKGEGYSLNHDVLHRITSDRSRTTMTLMAQGTRLKQGARVFTDDNGGLPKTIDAVPFSLVEMRRKFEEIIEISPSW